MLRETESHVMISVSYFPIVIVIVVFILSTSANAFHVSGWNPTEKRIVQPATTIVPLLKVKASTSCLGFSKSKISLALLAGTRRQDENDEDEDDLEMARVRRSRRESRQFDENKQEQDGNYYDTGRDTQSNSKQEYDDNDEDYTDWEDDEDYDEDDDEIDYELLGNILVPNPILDSIDPDGAAERFPELARDPRFWFDMLLFVAFLDFVAYAGPRNPLPDLPPLY
jgi:hypothetical protein